jgi:hypothetical protein
MQDMKTGNKSFENVEKFKYLEIPQEIEIAYVNKLRAK